MTYKFKASPTFWKAFYRLNDRQQDLAREKFKVFKVDPFHPSLGAHRIAKLSARYDKTIFAIEIEGNLRSTFYRSGDTIYSVDIGTHDIYKK